MFLSTCPRSVLPTLRHVRPHVIISITDPVPWADGSWAQVPELDDCLLDVLHLQFADFHERHFPHTHTCEKTGEIRPLREWAMKPGDASCIREFLENWYGKYETVIVSCEAGVSRSPSIALAIAEKFSVNKYSIEPVYRNWDFQPLNPWCYKLTKEALHEFRNELR